MQRAHPFANDMDHDEWARCAFAMSLRQASFKTMLTDMPKLNREVLTPRFKARVQRDPVEPLEVMDEIESCAGYGLLSSVLINAQDLLWSSCADIVDKRRDETSARYADVTRNAKGTLTLDPGLSFPNYLAEADIHRMPGGFHTECGGEDVRAGALYDLGGAIYQIANGRSDNGLMLNDGRGHAGVAFLFNEFPGFKPQRILDMGCTVGQSTLPYVDYFPDAEIHAIDVGAPVLRFAHARAEAMGKEIHFSQRDAEHTNFPEASFDLVVSHILLHETSPDAVEAILSESYRLLKPGGVMMHIEVPLRAAHRDFYALPFLMWEQFNNNEPNLVTVANADFDNLVKTAGFDNPKIGYYPATADANACAERMTEELPPKPCWLVISARKE